MALGANRLELTARRPMGRGPSLTESLTGAPYGKRSEDRVNQRKGFRDRSWEPHAGTIELRVSKLRHGSYFPAFLEPRRMAETALTAVIQEAYVQGVSTRAVDDHRRTR